MSDPTTKITGHEAIDCHAWPAGYGVAVAAGWGLLCAATVATVRR
ncbi:hypothetical protein [Nocardia brasiliensis]|nr:hypothetical protein [Nocardia brasiliensis]